MPVLQDIPLFRSWCFVCVHVVSERVCMHTRVEAQRGHFLPFSITFYLVC